MVDIALVAHPADGGPPAGQFHSAEYENLLRGIAGQGVHSHEITATITGLSRVITLPAFDYSAPDGDGNTVDCAYAGGSITPTAGGALSRLDIIVGYDDATVAVIAGVETELSSTVVEPPMPDLPDNAILLMKVPVGAGQGVFSSATALYGRAIFVPAPVQQEIVKPIDETVSATTTLHNDGHFLLEDAPPNTDILIELILRITSGTAPDFKWAWALTGMTFEALSITDLTAPALESLASTASGGGGDVIATGAAVARIWGGTFVIHTGSTGGDLHFQWAPNTSDAGATSVLKNSVMRHRELGAT